LTPGLQRLCLRITLQCPAPPSPSFASAAPPAACSGYDGDGAAALCGIRDAGGITIAQAPATARFPDMPDSAIASGCVDFILSPEAIAGKIVSIASQNNVPTAGKMF